MWSWDSSYCESSKIAGVRQICTWKQHWMKIHNTLDKRKQLRVMMFAKAPNSLSHNAHRLNSNSLNMLCFKYSLKLWLYLASFQLLQCKSEGDIIRYFQYLENYRIAPTDTFWQVPNSKECVCSIMLLVSSFDLVEWDILSEREVRITESAAKAYLKGFCNWKAGYKLNT